MLPIFHFAPPYTPTQTIVQVPATSLYTIVTETLSTTPGIRYRRDDNWFWTIEFGTKPLEKDQPTDIYHQIMRGKVAASEAAEKASQRFHLDDEDDEEEDEFFFSPENARWCESHLMIYKLFGANEDENIHIGLTRWGGDRRGNWLIWNTLQRNIERNMLFMKRMPFLQLFEGIDNDDMYMDFIQRYLFDILLVKELCTYF